MKKRSMLRCLTVSSLAALPLVAQAIECEPEPTDMPVEYGDLITCQTDTTNDVDYFRFAGSVGDRVIIDVSNVDDVRPCILLTAPDGSTIDEKCQNVSGQIIDTVLENEGPHTIAIWSYLKVANRVYTFGLTCLLGECAPLPECNACDWNDDGRFSFRDVTEFWQSCKAE